MGRSEHKDEFYWFLVYLIVEHFLAFRPGKPGSRWSPSFHKQCRTQLR